MSTQPSSLVAATDRGSATVVRWCISALVASTVAICVLWTNRDYGLAIDEATYVWVIRELREWFVELPERGFAPSLSQEGIARRWHFLEPPAARHADQHSNFNLPLSHYLMAFTWLIGHRLLGLLPELAAYRLASTLLFAFCLAAVYYRLAARHGPATGLLAVGFLLATPRVFGHAHLATTETPLACLWTLSLLALARATEPAAAGTATRRSVLAACLVGLTMTVKLTGWLILPPTLLWLLLLRPPGWQRLGTLLLLLPPLLLVALTPPLWHHPLDGLIDYVQNARANPWKITAFYLSEGYQGGLPLSSAPTLIAITTPVTILLFSMLGALTCFGNRFGTLLTLSAGTLLGFRMAGLMPQHDVERQFLPYFYLAAILAALGFDAARRSLARALGLSRWSLTGRRLAQVVCWLLVLLALAEPLIDSWIYRRHALSYYNRLVEGLPGAARFGFEISYWFEGVTDADWRELLTDLPPGSRIFLRPDHPGLELLREWGLWRADLQSVGPGEADYYLLYAKRAAYVVPDPDTGKLQVTDLLVQQQQAPAIREIRFLGVRLVALLSVR